MKNTILESLKKINALSEAPNTPKGFPKKDKNDDFYVEFDKDSNSWGVFGTESGHAYGLHSTKEQANDDCEKRKKKTDKSTVAEAAPPSSNKKLPPSYSVPLTLPTIVKVNDYHEFKDLESNLKQLGLKVKVSEIGFSNGMYIGVVFANSIKKSEAIALAAQKGIVLE